jgi:hypothetical protein
VTITRHTIGALMQVDPPYWRNTSDVPLWADSVQGAVQWAPYDSSITVTKVMNAGRYELRLDWNRASGTQQVQHQVVTVPGKYYRLVASMYTTMPKMTAQATGAPNGGSPASSPSRDLTATPYEVWGVFAATATATFLTLKSPAPWAAGINDPPATGTVFVTEVALYEVERTTYLDLHPVQASVRLDSEWSPYVRVDLTCPLPPADALSRIDPRGVDSSGQLKAVPARVVINLSAVGGDTRTAGDLTAELHAAGIATAAQWTTFLAGRTAAYLTDRYSDPYTGTVPTRTNLATNPRAATLTAPSGGLGWVARWFGNGGSGTTTLVTGAADGPAASVTTYARKTWTVAPSLGGSGDVGFQHTAGYSSTGTQTIGYPVTAGTTYTLSTYLRASITMGITPPPGWIIRVVWRNAAGTFLSNAPVGSPSVSLPAGTWTRITATVTAPAGAAYMEVITSNGGNVVGGIPVGARLEGTAMLVEVAAAPGTYFDGSTPDTFTIDHAWTSTADASTSTESAMDAGLASSRRLDVHLRSREVDYVAGTMRLECTSDEMYLQDFARYDTSTSTWTPPATISLRVLVSWALNLFGWTLQPEGTDAAIDAAKVIWNLGETLWSFLDANVRGSGKRLWCDEARRWYLTDSIPAAAGVATIAALTTCTDTLSRADEAYGDAAVMAFEWSDPAGAAHRDYAFAYTTGLLTPKTVVSRFTDQQPAPGAAAAGVGRLRTRAMSRGRAIVARAVSSYAVTPGQQALITTPVTTITGALVSAVTWNVPDDEMDVTTRDVVA